jgi:opacity protein-like surface antigen
MRNLIMCAAAVLAAVLTSSVFAAEWTTPVPVTAGINTQFDESTPYLSYDGKSLYFSRGYTDNDFYFHIYEAKRSQPSGPFTSVSEVYTSSYHTCGPWVSPDNLRMYYWHELPNTWQIEVSRRASVNDPWSQGTVVSGLPGNAVAPSLSADELTMVFNNPNVGGWDMYIATRQNINSAFGNIRSLTELNTAGFDGKPFLSPDALSIYWSTLGEIFQATRSSVNDPFGNAQILSALDMPGRSNAHPAISSDGKEIYFVSNLLGDANADIYVSYLVPEPATLLLLGLGAAIAVRRR